MDKAIAQGGNRFSGALLFNVGVESVEHGAEIRMVDLIDQSPRLGSRRQEIAFEPVEIFNGQLDLGFFRDFRRLS